MLNSLRPDSNRALVEKGLLLVKDVVGSRTAAENGVGTNVHR